MTSAPAPPYVSISPDTFFTLIWPCTSSPTVLGLPLLGLFVDRACEPAPGAVSDRARFRNHGAYVSAVARQAGLLVQQGYLLAEDADRMVDIAGESQIGKPDSCD